MPLVCVAGGEIPDFLAPVNLAALLRRAAKLPMRKAG
jgi:hypothetical protein